MQVCTAGIGRSPPEVGDGSGHPLHAEGPGFFLGLRHARQEMPPVTDPGPPYPRDCHEGARTAAWIVTKVRGPTPENPAPSTQSTSGSAQLRHIREVPAWPQYLPFGFWGNPLV